MCPPPPAYAERPYQPLRVHGGHPPHPPLHAPYAAAHVSLSLRVKCVPPSHAERLGPASAALRLGRSPHPPKRTAMPAGPLGSASGRCPSSHPPPNVVGAEEPFHSSLPGFALSLSGTEKGQKSPAGAVGKSPQRRGCGGLGPAARGRPARPLARSPPRPHAPAPGRPRDGGGRQPPRLPYPGPAAARADGSRSESPLRQPRARCSRVGQGAARLGGRGRPFPLLSAARPHLVALVGLERADRRLGELHMQYGDVVLSQPPARQPVPLLFPQTCRRRRPRRHLKLPGVPPPTPLGLQLHCGRGCSGARQPPPQLRPSRC